MRLLCVASSFLEAVHHRLQAGGVAIRTVVDAFLHSFTFVFSSSPAHDDPLTIRRSK